MSKDKVCTSGPWDYKDNSLRTDVLVTCQPGKRNKGIVATMARMNMNAEADARLIAAAPDMLSVLEMIAGGYLQGMMADDINAVRNAIKKARG